ncbi:Protein of unknown function [Anaerovibrio lipolyticus DSM 3074]|uniref:Phage-like protein n=2 Tax=Anaerovibrio lipolyticus TaxID=82374 RepID=A0A0B2JVE8_9FIRM|nr:DUF2815 family protein [Anaerovibrio lipolyticus]KHM51619.1 hypothetical protein NZ47_09565 [Anaerovibrio lipolyticus]SHI78591.1 Protein of unknown function [Anaerovibrio lipolyticus DSM 3074]
MSTKFTTGLVRLSYPHLFKPAETLNGDMKFSASFIIPKNSKTAKRAQEVVDKMMKDSEVKQVLGKTKIKYELLRDGDEKEDPAYENSFFINAKSNEDHKPKLYTKDREEIVDPNELYAGCYVQAVLSFYPYNKNGNSGIGASLLAVRFIKDGEPLTGGTVTDDDWDDDLLEGDGLDDLM